VKSFGFKGDDRTGRIGYYKSDKNFAIRLLPKDREHEIIIIKAKSKQSTLLNYYNNYKKKCAIFKKDTIWWKHKFYEDDIVQIPFINFNITYDYETIVGSHFFTDHEYEVIKANQKTGFILNEKGATAESFALIEVVESASDAVFEKPKPKLMIFNTDFVVFLKRKDADFPYFGVYIANDELMGKFEEVMK